MFWTCAVNFTYHTLVLVAPYAINVGLDYYNAIIMYVEKYIQ